MPVKIEEDNPPLSECCNCWFYFMGFNDHDDVEVKCSFCGERSVL